MSSVKKPYWTSRLSGGQKQCLLPNMLAATDNISGLAGLLSLKRSVQPNDEEKMFLFFCYYI